MYKKFYIYAIILSKKNTYLTNFLLMKYVFSITFEFKSFYQAYFTWCLLWNLPSGISCKQIAIAKLNPNFMDASKPEPNR